MIQVHFHIENNGNKVVISFRSELAASGSSWDWSCPGPGPLQGQRGPHVPGILTQGDTSYLMMTSKEFRVCMVRTLYYVISWYTLFHYTMFYSIVIYIYIFWNEIPGVQRGCITGPFPSPYRELAPEPIPVANPQGEQCSQNLMFDAATSMYGDLYFFKNGWAKFAFSWVSSVCVCTC